MPSKKSEEKKHSKYSASGSERWLNCPGSIQACEGLESPESEFSLEGSAAHAIGEVCLKTGIEPRKIRWKGKIEEKFNRFVNSDMIQEVQKYYKVVMDLVDGTGAKLLVEHKLNLSHIEPTMFGTSDAIIVEPWGDIHVFDLKFGKGIKVNAVGNSQQAFYGLGSAIEVGWDFGLAHINIFQPRLDWHSTWEINHTDLKGWEETFKKGVKATKAKNAPRVAGDWCKFCPAKVGCSAIKESVQASALVQFDDASKVPKITKLTPEQISSILEKGPMIEDFLSDVRAFAHRRLEHGYSVPGWKLVNGRGRRVWSDEKYMMKAYKNNKKLWSVPEFLSPAQAEKVLGKQFVKDNATFVSGKKVLAKEDDSRQIAEREIEEQFNDQERKFL